jgi:Zinc knuckle
MSHILDRADELRKQAITLLVTERRAIDERLRMLAYDGAEPSTPTEPKTRVCRECGEPGHNSRRCPKRSAHEPSNG